MNVLLIGGDFDDNGGRKSGYIEKFANGLRPYHLFVKTINGGYYDELLKISMSECQAILWFANIPNDKPKFVNEIKSKFPKALLVISKNNIDGKYQTMDLVARALKAKANLIIEFTKNESGAICGTILDPLCNCYGGYKHSDVFLLSTLLAKRLWQLINFTRVESKSVGNKIDSCANPSFVETIKWYGDRFHSLIHGVDTSRFLGNASFRCERGFPSYRDNRLIFVSKRNIDKREISSDSFVACELDSLKNDRVVRYYGNDKPSVDTPIQLCLYGHYAMVNYIIHSHVYVKDAPFTGEKIPCGALEEVDHILSVWPQRDIYNFAINLKGHGSIVFSRDLWYFDKVNYIARPVPEGE